MKKHLLLKFVGITLTTMLGAAYSQTAHAQTQYLDGVIIGNRSGTGSQYLIKASSDYVAGPYLHFFPNSNGVTTA